MPTHVLLTNLHLVGSWEETMKYEFDLVIIGAGSAGIVAGEAAPRMGVRTALIEPAATGGAAHIMPAIFCMPVGCASVRTARPPNIISRIAISSSPPSLAKTNP